MAATADRTQLQSKLSSLKILQTMKRAIVEVARLGPNPTFMSTKDSKFERQIYVSVQEKLLKVYEAMCGNGGIEDVELMNIRTRLLEIRSQVDSQNADCEPILVGGLGLSSTPESGEMHLFALKSVKHIIVDIGEMEPEEPVTARRYQKYAVAQVKLLELYMDLSGRALDRGQLGQVTSRLRATMLQFRACEWVNDVRNILASDAMMGEEQEVSPLTTRGNTVGDGGVRKRRNTSNNSKTNRMNVGPSKLSSSRPMRTTEDSISSNKASHKQKLLELYRALPASIQSFGMPRLANFFRTGAKFPIGPFVENVDKEDQCQRCKMDKNVIGCTFASNYPQRCIRCILCKYGCVESKKKASGHGEAHLRRDVPVQDVQPEPILPNVHINSPRPELPAEGTVELSAYATPPFVDFRYLSALSGKRNQGKRPRRSAEKEQAPVTNRTNGSVRTQQDSGSFVRDSDIRAAKGPVTPDGERSGTADAVHESGHSATGSIAMATPPIRRATTSLGSWIAVPPSPTDAERSLTTPDNSVEKELLLDEMRVERRRLETLCTRLALQVEHLRAEEQKLQDQMLLEELRAERKRLEVQLMRVKMQVRHLQFEENWMVDPVGKDEVVEIERP